MKNIIGKPYALKQVNLSLVRNAIKERGSATRSEIVELTRISVTTVRALLTEMVNNNEVFNGGFDESIGGRKAVRYRLNKDHFFGVALCLSDEDVEYITVNVCGEIQERGTFKIEGDVSNSICLFLDQLIDKINVRSIGIGVPGVVNDLGYQRKNLQGIIENHNVGELVKKRYGLPVILENDLNAITLGFGRFHLKESPEKQCENLNLAYIQFDKDCISAGFLSDGRILRGFNNFVGELGLYPVDKLRTLDDVLAEPLTNELYSQIVAKIISSICCVLNPEYVALGGDNFRNDCLPLIIQFFENTLPEKMLPEIIYTEDKMRDYFEGMAHLTSEQIFADTLLIKE